MLLSSNVGRCGAMTATDTIRFDPCQSVWYYARTYLYQAACVRILAPSVGA